jgi:hypothetical protein
MASLMMLAFPLSDKVGTPKGDFGAQWLACVCPCQRFTRDVTIAGA